MGFVLQNTSLHMILKDHVTVFTTIKSGIFQQGNGWKMDGVCFHIQCSLKYRPYSIINNRNGKDLRAFTIYLCIKRLLKLKDKYIKTSFILLTTLQPALF